MPDSPDFSKYLPGSVRFSLEDMGELAARLYSPVVFDRRGEIVWMDDFRGGLSNWITAVSGTGASAAISAINTYRGGFVARLVAGTNVTKLAAMAKIIGGWVGEKMGVEFCIMFSLDALTTLFQIGVYTGTELLEVRLRYTHSAYKWELLNNLAVYETILIKDVNITGGYMYIPIKIVADLIAGKYMRVLIGDIGVDVSSIEISSSAAADTPSYHITVTHTGMGGNNPELNIAHVILTANEP